MPTFHFKYFLNSSCKKSDKVTTRLKGQCDGRSPLNANDFLLALTVSVIHHIA